MRTFLCAACLAAALPSATAAASAPPAATTPEHTEEAAQRLNAVVVNATPLRQRADQLVKPVSVLEGVALDAARSTTLGQTVANIPGVQTTAYGQGAGRPVIRGLDASRVMVLQDGIAAGDVSAVSQDHAVSIEPFLADQIEILKGPATLLHGSGAIGGVVNVIDGRIPQAPPPDGFSGRVQAQGDHVSNGGTGMFRIDAGNERYALHADGLKRHLGDYAIPGGTLANSYIKGDSGAVGASLFGDWGHLGASVSRFLDTYGNPAEPGDTASGEVPVHIAMAQTRQNLKGALDTPMPGIDHIEFSLGHSDYRHTEFAGSQADTSFTRTATEGRVVLSHLGAGGWSSAFGAQASKRALAAIGEESFIPPTRTRGLGLFLTGQRELGALKLELGARGDREESHPDNGPMRDFRPLSLSAGLAWRLDAHWHLSLNLDRAQRAPAEEELFADGPHAASATWEIGNPNLQEETAHQMELGLHYHGERIEAKVSAWYNRYRDFIYLADTGAIEDGFPVRLWSQADATLRGGEAEATLHLAKGSTGHYDLRLWADAVRATLDAGGNLPRMPAARLGAELSWRNDDWRASVGATHYFSQDKVATHETDTAAFTAVSARLAWSFHNDAHGTWEAFLHADNLANQTARLATSLIKDQAPLPGRNLTLGLRGYF